jgi:aquaporin TIP
MVKLAFGRFGESFSVGSLKAYLSEFIATLLFVFAGVGSAIAYGKDNLTCTGTNFLQVGF